MRNFLQRTGTVLFLMLTFMVTKAQDITAKWDFQNGVPASITSVNIQGTNASGTVESDVEGIVMAVLAESETTAIKLQYNSSGYAQFNTGTVLQVPVKNAGDEVTVVSYPGQFKFTVGGTAATDNTTLYSASAADARKGYVEVIATATAYLYSITVVQKPAEEAEVLTDKAATATFPFDTGEAGQTADFGDNAGYFLNSKVELGDGLTYKDQNSSIGISQTRIQPEAKGSAAGEDNAIQFIIQPKFGYTFTPKSVSFQATRYGTDGGKLDVAWVNPDGTTVSLATGVQPNRNNNETQKYTDFSYEISGATVAEGACGLQINLYNLDTGKQYGFDKIVITGIPQGEFIANVCLNGDKKLCLTRQYKVGEQRSGTGDVFSAVIIADAVNHVDFERSVRRASHFVKACILKAVDMDIPTTDGVPFEEVLGRLKAERPEDRKDKKQS